MRFRLIFRSSTAASAAVVAIFMGGLGLAPPVGNACGPLAKPTPIYALLELGSLCRRP